MTQRIERRFVGNASFASPQSGSAVARRSVDVGPESPDGKLPRIVGYSAMFEAETEIASWFGSFKEKISRGAFSRAIKEKQNVRALRNHDSDNVLASIVGGTLVLTEDRTGLYAEIDTANTSVGRDTVELIRRGDITGQSFAFIPRKVTWINGKDGDLDMRIIEDVDLYDVGPVTYPAYEQTTVDIEEASKVHEEGLRKLGKPLNRRKIEPVSEEIPAEKPAESEIQPEIVAVPPASTEEKPDSAGNEETPNPEVVVSSSEQDLAREKWQKVLQAEKEQSEVNKLRSNLLTE